MVVTLLRACGLQLRAGDCPPPAAPAAPLRLPARLARGVCSPAAASRPPLCPPCPLPFPSLACRAADPVAMKELVVAVHARAAAAAGAGGLSKRAQLLLELVVDVKNNRCVGWGGQGWLGGDGQWVAAGWDGRVEGWEGRLQCGGDATQTPGQAPR